MRRKTITFLFWAGALAFPLGAFSAEQPTLSNDRSVAPVSPALADFSKAAPAEGEGTGSSASWRYYAGRAEPVENPVVANVSGTLVTAVSSGAWSSAATWDASVPGPEDDVFIPAGLTVAFDGDFTCGKITVNGKLEVARTRTALTCDSIMVIGDGAVFEIGTPADRFIHDFTLTLTGLPADATGMMGSKFVGATNGGRLEFHGEERLSWTRLGADADAGSSSITLTEPVDWRPGEEILVTSTSTRWNEAEKRVIESVSRSGLTVNLTVPLSHFHTGQTVTHTRPTDGKTWSVELRAEVGLLSRNVTIQGDSASEENGYGAHIMVMNMNSPGFAAVQGVELYRVGQKSILGRYPFHWHMLLNAGEGQYFRNNSVHRSFNRAITIHGTESTLVEDNFFYDHIGHGVFLEDGSERFNRIRKNVVVLTKRPAPGEELTPSDNEANEPQNRTPSSYWITNPNNIFEDNVAAGTQGTGFWFAMPTSPMGLSGAAPYFEGLQPHTEPLGAFNRNTAHSCMNGFDVNDQLNGDHSLRKNGTWANNGPFFLNDCTWYSNDIGIYAGIGGRRQNVVYYNNTFADNKTAIFIATYQLIEESLLIANTGLTKLARGTKPAMYAVYDGAGRMKNNHMIGWDHADARLFINIGAAIKHPNHRFEGFTWDHTGTPTNILPNYDIVPPPDMDANHVGHPRMWAQVILDLDGSITGLPNSSIIANNRFMTTGDEHQPSNWRNNLVTHRRFAQMRSSYSLSSSQNPDVTVVRTKPGTPAAGVYYVHGFKEPHHQLPFIVNDGFIYTYYYESLPSSRRINFRLDDAEIGDTVTLRVKEFGRHSGLNVTKMVSHSSLTSLLAAEESGYYAELNGDLYLRPVATSRFNTSFTVTWSGSITLPVWDSDGDGVSNADEAAAGSDAFDFLPILEISDIADQSIPVNSTAGPLAFTVGEQATDPGTLAVSGRSSNAALVPDENIIFGGSGASRTVTVTPTEGQAGEAAITIVLTDGVETASTSFQLTVEMPPSLAVEIDPIDPQPAGFTVARAWHWDIDGETEGWSGKSHLELEAGSPIRGIIRGSATGSDPQWISPANLDVPAVPEVVIEFRVRKESADPTRIDLFWADDDGGFSSARQTTIEADDLPRDDGFHVIRLHYSRLVAGTLSQVRLDPIADSDGIGRAFDLDYVRIYVLDESPSKPPRLRIERGGENELRLSWRSAADAWTLQSSSEASGGFTDTGFPVGIEENEHVAHTLMLSSRKFYRLIESSAGSEKDPVP